MANLNRELKRLYRKTPRPARWFVGIGVIGLASAALAMWPQIRGITDIFFKIHPSAQAGVLMGLCGFIIFNVWNLFNYYRRFEAAEAERDKYKSLATRVKRRVARVKQRLQDAIADRVAAEKAKQDFIKGEEDLWATAVNGQDTFVARDGRQAIFVSAFNLKGGVGKTTLTANVGACLTHLLPTYRVILVDLDPQGTLSTYSVVPEMLTFQWANSNTAERLFDTNLDASSFDKLLTPSPGVDRLRVIVSNDRLDRTDFRGMASFFLNGPQDEVRFHFQRLHRLAALVHQPTLVIFDCAPRLTTSVVNALTCSDYVIVPTKLDDNSTPAVPRAINVLEKKLPLLVRAKLAGVIANETRPHGDGLIKAQQKQYDNLANLLRTHFNQSYIFKNTAKHMTEAGHGEPGRIPSSLPGTVQNTFMQVAKELKERLAL